MELRPPAVILVSAQLPENIGSTARSMANFGLSDLRLVRPRKGWPQRRAWALASGANHVLEQLKVFEDTAEAIADLNLVYASTARPRETQQPVLTPRACAETLHEAASAGLATGLMFGAERTGLETPDIALCHGIVTIPVEDKHPSLNLSHAVTVNAYEWRARVLDAPPTRFRQPEPPADARIMQGLFDHLEGELEIGGFFHPPEKKPTMVRNLRVALNRARLTDQEAAMLRGAVVALAKGRGRALARMAGQPSVISGSASSNEPEDDLGESS